MTRPATRLRRLAREAAPIVAAVLAVAVGARLTVQVPGLSTPLTAQSLAVLVAGALLGPWRGAIAMAAYVVVGALGAPLFAGGASGPSVLTGPTGGFLVGFLTGAATAGAGAARGAHASLGGALALMAVATLTLVAPGLAWLAWTAGSAAAWQTAVGLAPGAAIKAAVGAVVVRGLR